MEIVIVSRPPTKGQQILWHEMIAVELREAGE